MTSKRWHVVAYHDRRDDPNLPVWTVSRSPDETGWETDSGHPGYGLTRADAAELANAANAAYERATDDPRIAASRRW